MTAPIVLAVDGGNSKTDLALVARRRRAARAGARAAELAAPHRARRLPARARGPAGRGAGGRRPAGRAAGRRGRPRAARRRRPAGRGGARCRRRSARAAGRGARRSATTRSRSCAPAPSAAGASRSCAAPASTASAWRPTAATCASPRSGAITGDWGGGYDVGLAALSAAARSEDGRGPQDHARAARCRRTSGCATPQRARPRRSTSAGSRRGACSSSRRWSSPRREDDAVAGRDRRPARRRGRRARARGADAARRSPASRSRCCSAAGSCARRNGRLEAAIAAGPARGGPADHARASCAEPPIVGAALLGPRRARRRSGGARPVRRELAVAAARRRAGDHGEHDPWLRCASSRRPSSTPATTRPAVDALDLRDRATAS